MIRNFVRVAMVGTVFALGIFSGRDCLAALGQVTGIPAEARFLTPTTSRFASRASTGMASKPADEVAHGLTSQDYKTILQAIQANGYNTVRLPFSNQMVENPIVPSAIHSATGPAAHQHRPAGIELARNHGCDHRLCGNDRVAGHPG